ncbi:MULTISPECIES: CdaR family transcriptional regulator [unclassified Micromonospora]|uniref:PucR family transcriptional regulator n=1 Tax=unclassified Micromonospora TaxID=2617518 RepID=UPI001C5D9262|nr:helix-turn-helix domain-containing protein [Micromonospora sp. RL09-050-HVF-A]MBW4701770.1 helix-turn-helix domain-containing protein [Micromonospora sp. RL09-050-HVF-A]
MSRSGELAAARPRLAVAAAPSPAAFAQWLAELAFGGAGWPELLAAVAERTGAACRLVAESGELLAASDGADGPRCAATPDDVRRALVTGRAGTGVPTLVRCVDGWTGRAVAVGAGSRRLGALLLAEPVAAGQLALAGAATTALLIEAVRHESPPPAVRDAATVLRALRDGLGDPTGSPAGPAGGGAGLLRAGEAGLPQAGETGPSAAGGAGPLRPGEAELLRAGAAHGWRLDQPHAVAGIAYTGAQQRRWASALSWLDRPVLAEGRRAWTLLHGDVEREVTRLRVRLDQIVGAGQVRVVAGALVTGPARTAESFRDADRLLRLLLRAPDERVELPFGQAGLAQVLLAVPDERLRWFVHRHLGPIAHRDDLLRTLDCWLATGGSRQAVSERLHLHRNSVGYRVGLIKRLLGVDPLDPQTVAVLRTALAARELLAASEAG